MVSVDTLERACTLVGVVEDAVQRRARAAYLHGSAVHGGLRPDSDLDLLLVLDEPLVGADRLRLANALLPVSGRRASHGPARPVELTVVVWRDVVPWSYPARRDLQYGEWLRDDIEAGRVADPQPDPDLAVLLAGARERSHALYGPVAAAFFDPVPTADVQGAMRDSLPSLMASLVGDKRNVLLTLARMCVTAATGQVVPKDAAADWSLAWLPPRHQPVLALARDAYLGRRRDEWDYLQDAALAAALVLRNRVLSDGAG